MEAKELETKLREELEKLRAYLQQDGGDLEIVSIEGKLVTLKLKGACGCCPHAQATLKEGIENYLRENLDPEITVERA